MYYSLKLPKLSVANILLFKRMTLWLHIWVKITNDSKRGDTLVVNKGDAIAQGIILEYFKAEDDDP